MIYQPHFITLKTVTNIHIFVAKNDLEMGGDGHFSGSHIVQIFNTVLMVN